MATKYAFISYSRKTSEAADRIAKSLEAVGIPVWIDRVGIEPGTPSWERAIRAALQDSFAFILLASTAAGESSYVSQEYQIAQGLQCPIFPIWIEGSNWALSVPMGLGSAQYTDCRDALTAKAVKAKLADLVKKLKKLTLKHFLLNCGEPPHGYLTIKFEEERCVAVNPLLYKTFAELLDEFYMTYLNSTYPPFTYAQTWLLIRDQDPRHVRDVVAPWEILLRPRADMPLHELYPNWSAGSLSKYGLLPNTSWLVCKAENLAILGLLSDRKGFGRSNALTRSRIREKKALYATKFSDKDLSSADQVNPSEFHSVRVVAVDRDQVEPKNAFGKVLEMF